MKALMSNQLIDTPASVVKIGRLFLDHNHSKSSVLMDWPLYKFIRQLEKRYGGALSPEPEVEAMLQEYLAKLGLPKSGRSPSGRSKLSKRIHLILATEEEALVYSFQEFIDNFGKPMNELTREYWSAGEVFSLLHHAATAKTGKPSKKWLKTANKLIEKLPANKLNDYWEATLDLLLTTKPTVNERSWQDDVWLLNGGASQTVKGLLWAMSQANRESLSRKMARLAVAAYKKVPGKGPLATGIGNACVTALSITEDIHGISQLAGLRYRIKQAGIGKKVDKILEETANERGVSRQQIEDLSVMEFGLASNLLKMCVGEMEAEITLVKPGKATLLWRKGEKLQKSIPKAVKEGFAAELKAVKATKKALETDSINLRDRIDWSFRLDRRVELGYFEKIWQANSLLKYFADRLIWIFSEADDANPVTAIRGNNGWESMTGEPTDLTSKTTVRLWHPALANADEVEAWRNYLTSRELTQPLKQAFREVYILTAAEENTKTYSNRMAAHILKQHQFTNLARGRGWSYSLIGAYDHGMSTQACYQELPELGIRAEYIIQEMQDGDNFNETGIWLYVATDQVRFLNLNDNWSVIDLADVPPLLFSEVLRDTDLFVGVASIGNDDQWADSGGEVFQNYWRTYSTDQLTEVGQNRKLALQRLIPRLKIRDVATVGDKFVRVVGKRRTYKIHIGSGNILMEPNDQYLCIVPGTYGKKTANDTRVYLPFEGDRTLSIIISKALLLAADDEITDSTITRQLRR